VPSLDYCLVPTTTNWTSIRSQFPALQSGRAFLNTATYGQLPLCAKAAAIEHLDRRDRLACTDFLSWFDDLDALRHSIAHFINASADDIAFTTSASQGLATVLAGIPWAPGDEILTLEHEFPNNIYATHALQGVTGRETTWANLENAVTGRTRLVLISTVNYSSGLRPDLDAVLPRLRARGVLIYVDGTQSLGALPFDCSRTQPDFLSVDAYKWMISPNGAGFLYVRPEVREWLRPNVIGWRSDRRWRMVDNLHHGPPEWSPAAEKYEGGMLAFSSFYAMRASLGLIQQLGRDAIESRVMELASCIRQRLSSLGAEFTEFPGPILPSQIVLARFPGHDGSALAKQLQARNVIVSARKGGVRVSAHFYNHESDIDTLISELKSLL
jgi:cysteine desulfurase / selenocysteine lyase